SKSKRLAAVSEYYYNCCRGTENYRNESKGETSEQYRSGTHRLLHENEGRFLPKTRIFASPRGIAPLPHVAAAQCHRRALSRIPPQTLTRCWNCPWYITAPSLPTPTGS